MRLGPHAALGRSLAGQRLCMQGFAGWLDGTRLRGFGLAAAAPPGSPTTTAPGPDTQRRRHTELRCWTHKRRGSTQRAPAPDTESSGARHRVPSVPCEQITLDLCSLTVKLHRYICIYTLKLVEREFWGQVACEKSGTKRVKHGVSVCFSQRLFLEARMHH